MPSTIPRPPGVMGMTENTLAIPKAITKPSNPIVPPNARKKTHNDIASSAQFSDAHATTRTNNLRSEISPSMREPRCESTSAACCSSKRSRRASPLTTRSDLPCPSTKPKMMNAANAMNKTPTNAAVPYTALTPRVGMEMRRPNHKMRFNMTAEPMPAVAKANAASGPGTPLIRISRYPSAELAALPPGTTLPSAFVLS